MQAKTELLLVLPQDEVLLPQDEVLLPQSEEVFLSVFDFAAVGSCSLDLTSPYY